MSDPSCQTSCALMVLLAASCNADRASVKPVASETPPGPNASAPAAPKAPKIQLAGAGIDRVLIQPRGRGPVLLEKRNGSWMVASPEPATPADPSVVDALFADLDRTEFVAPVQDAPKDGLYLRILAERGETSVFDAWIGGQVAPRRQLFRADASSEVWVVRNIAPWINFSTAKDFRLHKEP